MRKFVAVWDHFDPDVLYLLKGDAKEIIKKIGEYSDYCYREIESESKLLGVEWNDEECYSWDVPGESLEDTKELATNDIYNQLKNIQPDDPDYIYLECCLFSGGEFEKEFDLENEQNILEATKVYVERFLKYIEDSYVDCDSSSAIAILDLENETVEIGQEVVFTTLEQLIGEDTEEEPANENENDYKKFRDAVLNGLKYKPSEWRNGQYVFNHINEYYGVARAVQHIDGIDCFHNDSKIDEFIEACYKRLV